jgi:hypothetical protein
MVREWRTSYLSSFYKNINVITTFRTHCGLLHLRERLKIEFTEKTAENDRKEIEPSAIHSIYRDNLFSTIGPFYRLHPPKFIHFSLLITYYAGILGTIVYQYP